MFALRCRLRSINGGGSLLFKSLLNYSTSADMAQPHDAILADYLMQSLGFSKEAAISTSNKVIRSKPMEKEPSLVVNYFEKLGLTRNQIRRIVSSAPKLLFYNVDRTLVPKIKVFQEFGLSGLDIGRVTSTHRTLLVKGLNRYIRPRIEYLRKLFGTDDRVAAALKKYSLKTYKLENVQQNILLLQKAGFTDDYIVKFIVKDTKNILFASAQKLQNVLSRVETELRIPRESAKFVYGVYVLCSFSKSNIERKLGIFKGFGWSDADILEMLRIQPLILCSSADRTRKGLDYFMKELGYNSEYLATHPVLLSLNLERRVKPRDEVLRILNENNLNKTNAVLYTVLIRPEAKFVKDYILPHKDSLPDMCAEYFKKVGMQKMKSP